MYGPILNTTQNASLISIAELKHYNGIALTEQMGFSFNLGNKNHFNETSGTCEIFYKLMGFSIIESLYPIEIFDRIVTISNVIETKNTNSWCSSNNSDVEKVFIQNSSEFRIFTSNSVHYHVYVFERERYYSSGYFILSILYTPRQPYNYDHFQNFSKYHDSQRKIPPDFIKYNLTDVTSLMLNGNNDSNIETTFLLVNIFKV